MNENQPINPLENVSANETDESIQSEVVEAQVSPKVRILAIAFYWFKIVLQPLIAVVAIVGLAFGFGFAQKHGYFISADANSDQVADVDDGTEYVCPMLCVPPSKQPGRCPVCGMELKPRKSSGDSKDVYGLTIDPASRRLSNIQTVVAATMPLTKHVTALGRIGYDETSEATISAYVDGRIEKMFVGFTGANVRKGEQLAMLYSPDLYSSQVELLESKKAMENSTSDRQRIIDSNRRLYEGARRRLIEFGLPESQVAEIEKSGNADSRIKIVSPISGTVTEKMADEGQYVKTGLPLFRVANLSKVWLMLELFPEDASMIRYGQDVTVTLRSHAARQFQGRVAFIDPVVNQKTQTIPVRVVVPNESGLIGIGDFAEATIRVDVDSSGQNVKQVYDPTMAGKWISPMHPHIVRDEPGKCPVCGVDLVPASQFGFVAYQPDVQGVVVVPRHAILISGKDSVAYVETKPGRFEFRQVEVGPISGEQVAVVSGIKPGESVVSNAAFMVDAAFNMSGKPSLIDPTRAINVDQTKQSLSPDKLAAIKEAFSSLSAEDRKLAESQEICPVTEFALGSMGTPIKLTVNGRDVFVCCAGCTDRLKKDPEKYFAILDAHSSKLNAKDAEEEKKIEEALAALSEEDKKLVIAQGYCPVADFRLGGMGTPIKVDVKGETVFLCCEGCRDGLLDDPDTYLAKVAEFKKNGGKLKSESPK